MFKFWYEFIPKATSVIEMGQGALYYQKAVKPFLHSFMGSVFEEMCRYYTLNQGITGAYGCFVTSVGTWWGVENITDKNGYIRAQSADIDIVALSDIDKKAVIGECKFKNEKLTRVFMKPWSEEELLYPINTKFQNIFSFLYQDIQIGSTHYLMKMFCCLH